MPPGEGTPLFHSYPNPSLLLSSPLCRPPPTQVFEQRGIQPVRTEMSIYDEDLDLAGVVGQAAVRRSACHSTC